jgi:hypothetical protein
MVLAVKQRGANVKLRVEALIPLVSGTELKTVGKAWGAPLTIRMPMMPMRAH